MPRISGSPPSQAAERDRLKYEGPHRFGHKYPEPINGNPTDWMIEPNPTASIERDMSDAVNSRDALSWLAKRIGRQRDITINITCCIESTISCPKGGTSFTEYSYFLIFCVIDTPVH